MNSENSTGEAYDLFKTNTTKMTSIGSEKTIINDKFYLGISKRNNTIKLLPLSTALNTPDYAKELLKFEASGRFSNAVFKSVNGEKSYYISSPKEDITGMNLVFAKNGFLKTVVYEFNSSYEGNPYQKVTINYEVYMNVASYKKLGLLVNECLIEKNGKYYLTKAYENYEFVNLLDNKTN